MPDNRIPPRGPLDGITVVTLEQAVAAPLATRQLADLGARVVKIERPGGDFARRYDKAVDGESSYFVWLNRGKESVELDVKQPGDRRLLDAMLAGADVFVQNLIPGAAERLGLDAATLRASRPELIHCSISGYGPEGPYRDKKAYDLLLQCETGLVMSTGTPDVPAKAGASFADIATGMYAYSGILTALYDRTHTGTGASLHVAMIDALGEWMSQPAYFSYGEPAPRRTAAKHPSISPYGPYRTADGTVFLGIQNEREWASLCRGVLGRPELEHDPRFGTNPDRVVHDAELTELLETEFATRDTDAVLELLDHAGIANARMRTPAEFTRHPQLTARDRWRTVDIPGGNMRALVPPVESDTWRPVMGAVPRPGQHTAALYAEFLSPASESDSLTGESDATTAGADATTAGADATAAGADATAAGAGATAVGSGAMAAGSGVTAVESGAMADELDATTGGSGAMTAAPDAATGDSERVHDGRH
ncbi:Formyl-CoA:oxalate CoA-transferase [Nocardia sp. RB20]|uniref:Formyl-CoA:oxalate CoA-transferase n=1 Tax=Nocardia macrotermitis TaxID=2585198 RepID=A0A7K0DEA8_9NOCA|nr:CaiB/BaiF CoA-transferase family protein [Nocardia macrotermitis]MQY24136.1 Formyl-CoA:oxalate CoA-transferase [Nocardia macrotermitis]